MGRETRLWKRKKKLPLKWSMIGMLVLGWLLPLMLLTFCLLYFVSSTLSAQIEKTIVVSTDKAVEITQMQLEEMMNSSKVASYVPEIKEAYLQYTSDGNRRMLYDRAVHFLNQQYRYDKNFLCTMLYFLDEPQYIYYCNNNYMENNRITSGYDSVVYYKRHVMESVNAMSDKLDTKIRLFETNGHFYMIRNIVDDAFQPYATIVMELLPSTIFESLNSVWGEMAYEVYLDGVPVINSGVDAHFDTKRLTEAKMDQAYYVNYGRWVYSYKIWNNSGQQVAFLLQLDPKTIINSLTMVQYVFVLVLIFMIPLIFMVFRFFYTRVTKPVSRLVSAAQEIGEGSYGYTIEHPSNSKEFDYLNVAFNAMSRELKHQFEQIYLEELALRDANIMALQSQINPHFLNNTLEIINWEARMNGNDKVSGMIEALATMLNATMNRKQQRFVPLKEELSYVDAYLYIIKQRFGERFWVSREVEEELLAAEVPMLIIQPIVENAVEHGMKGPSGGGVSINIYSRKEDGERKMLIEICNDGELSQEDAKRIDYLLGSEIQEENERHVSLGIRNVDKRLKIIYGSECGLTIKSDNRGKTISTLIVKIDNEHNKSQ